MLQANVVEGFRKAGIPRNYQTGESIVLENEPSTGMYLILKGDVKVVIRQPDGSSLEVATMTAGQTMGEISLLLGQPHAATVIAKSETETLLLTQTRLQELRHDEPDLALHLFEILAFTLAGHLLDQNRQLSSLRKEVVKLKQKVDERSGQFSYFK